MTKLLAIILTVCMADTTPEPMRLRIDLIDGSSREVRLTEIKSNGALYHDAGRVSLEDVTRMTPLGDPSHAPANAPTARRLVYLTNGSRLNGELTEPAAENSRSLRLEVGLPKPLDLPLQSILAVRFSPYVNAEAQQELEARLANRPADKDMLLVVQGEKTVVLPGVLERLTPQGWEFTVGKKTQKQNLEAAYAVILGGPPPPPSPAVAVYMHGDSRILGRITSADRETLDLDADALGTIPIPWSRVRYLSLRSDRVVYLSDLRPASTQTRSALDVDFPPRMDAAVSGTPLRLRGLAFDKGIGVHANASITYHLDGGFEKLLALVGVDDGVAPYGSVVFRVLADGKKLFESKTLRSDDPPANIAVDLTGVRELILECDDSGDLDVSDHADWADARLLRARSTAVH
jgi:hypothetical protein